MSTKEVVWHVDGHSMQLELNKSVVSVASVICPNTGECSHPETSCVVDHFLRTYGLDCNVGQCDIDSSIEIAWTLVGGEKDLDSGQVWVIPRNDITFAGWLDSVNE